MGKHGAIFGLILCLCAAPIWAQKGLFKAGKNISRTVPRVTTTQLLKKVSPQAANIYGRELRALAASNRISSVKFPKLAQQNDLLLQRAFTLFAKQERLFAENLPDIGAKIDSRVYARVPYAKLLPKEVDVLYIGEVHGVPRVQLEISEIVKSLRDIYPGRTIYFAAESVPSAYDLDFSQEDLIFTEEALAERLQEVAESAEGELPALSSWDVVRAALQENIPILGLESEGALAQFATPEGNEILSEEEYEQIVTSLAGMEFRNQGFAQGIAMLRQIEPEALIVVYGGIDHLAYHQPAALPNMVGGKAFVVQVTVPVALADSNPFFKHFREAEHIRRMFTVSQDAKLAEFWKEPTQFNQLLGNDLTIIVHE